VDALFSRCQLVFFQLLQVTGHNRARQRQKLELVLADLAGLQEEAERVVARNYAMLSVDFASFAYPSTRRLDEVPLNTLIANIGGTLALFLGASVSSVFEWLELLLFSLLAAPLFILGKGSMVVRDERHDGDANQMDADTKRVLSNIRSIAARRRAGPGGGSGSGGGKEGGGQGSVTEQAAI